METFLTIMVPEVVSTAPPVPKLIGSLNVFHADNADISTCSRKHDEKAESTDQKLTPKRIEDKMANDTTTREPHV